MLKKSLLIILNLAFFISIIGCNSNEEIKEDDEQYNIYLLASEAGYSGTYEEWLVSIKGKDGQNGKSAYEIALENGFKGTVDEWLDSLSGTDGKDGQNGKSAYDIALENGFKGSVADWLLSLSGKDGVDGVSLKSAKINEDGYLVIELTNNESIILGNVVGADGVPGKDGIDGKDGVSIKNAKINENGNLIIELSNEEVLTLDNVVGSNGTPGKDGISIKNAIINEDGYLIINLTNGDSLTVGKVIGPQGEAGKDGKDGHDPVINIGENGNWFIDGIDTEISCIGEKGDPGLNGEAGKDGKQGESAYEIYLKYYPEYDKTEEEWINDLISGNLDQSSNHCVTFKNEYSLENIEVFVKHSYKVDKPDNPVVVGLKFDGWYYGETLWNFDIYPVLDDMELVAKFTSVDTISQVKNGAQNEIYFTQGIVTAISGDNLILSENNTISTNPALYIKIDNINFEVGDLIAVEIKKEDNEYIGLSHVVIERNVEFMGSPYKIDDRNISMIESFYKYCPILVECKGTITFPQSSPNMCFVTLQDTMSIVCYWSDDINYNYLYNYNGQNVTIKGYLIGESQFLVTSIE